MPIERACRLRGVLRLLDRTGVFMAEIRYFSVKCDGISKVNMQGEGLLIALDAVSGHSWLG